MARSAWESRTKYSGFRINELNATIPGIWISFHLACVGYYYLIHVRSERE
jgi:hypothetical protein